MSSCQQLHDVSCSIGGMRGWRLHGNDGSVLLRSKLLPTPDCNDCKNAVQPCDTRTWCVQGPQQALNKRSNTLSPAVHRGGPFSPPVASSVADKLSNSAMTCDKRGRFTTYDTCAVCACPMCTLWVGVGHTAGLRWRGAGPKARRHAAFALTRSSHCPSLFRFALATLARIHLPRPPRPIARN